MTGRVAIALAAGFEFAGEGPERKAYLDATEATPAGPKREVTWAFQEGKQKRHAFRPIRQAEEVTLRRLLELSEDEAWLRSNKDHPLALAVAAVRQLLALQRKMVLRPDAGPDPEVGSPLIRHDLIRKGKKRFYVPSHLSREEKERKMIESGF